MPIGFLLSLLLSVSGHFVSIWLKLPGLARRRALQLLSSLVSYHDAHGFFSFRHSCRFLVSSFHSRLVCQVSVATRAPPRSLRLLVSQYYAHVFVLLSDSLRSSISLASLLHRQDNSSALEKSSERSQSFLKELGLTGRRARLLTFFNFGKQAVSADHVSLPLKPYALHKFTESLI